MTACKDLPLDFTAVDLEVLLGFAVACTLTLLLMAAHPCKSDASNKGCKPKDNLLFTTVPAMVLVALGTGLVIAPLESRHELHNQVWMLQTGVILLVSPYLFSLCHVWNHILKINSQKIDNESNSPVIGYAVSWCLLVLYLLLTAAYTHGRPCSYSVELHGMATIHGFALAFALVLLGCSLFVLFSVQGPRQATKCGKCVVRYADEPLTFSLLSTGVAALTLTVLIASGPEAAVFAWGLGVLVAAVARVVPLLVTNIQHRTVPAYTAVDQ